MIKYAVIGTPPGSVGCGDFYSRNTWNKLIHVGAPRIPSRLMLAQNQGFITRSLTKRGPPKFAGHVAAGLRPERRGFTLAWAEPAWRAAWRSRTRCAATRLR